MHEGVDLEYIGPVPLHGLYDDGLFSAVLGGHGCSAGNIWLERFSLRHGFLPLPFDRSHSSGNNAPSMEA